MFNNIYHGKRVLVTGHTGFKGSWLSLWLQHLGADVCGYALESSASPFSHWDLLKLDMRSEIDDIRNLEKLKKVIAEFQPEIVFHLAAQSLVRRSYADPLETYTTNVIGTLNLFEACRRTDSVRAIVNITSDKCYENQEWHWGYRESDPMGGYDMYSSSKGCSELLTASYRNSYFNPSDFSTKHQTLLASCRAGNVIGGGDWAEDRLVPDLVRAVADGRSVHIRNPNSTRPWQHVLEPLSGNLLVGQKLSEGCVESATGWNFGPAKNRAVTVREVAEQFRRYWRDVELEFTTLNNLPHEANLLQLDCSRANALLGWDAVWDYNVTFDKTISWYRDFYEHKQVNTAADLKTYLDAFNSSCTAEKR
ncbi:MAG: CDP-glucose 4,6-dehydratase [Kiritimatiellia bacterium]